jgi:hypothetical protein
MESNPKVHPLHLSNNQLSNSNAADSSQRPNKVQKTNDHLPNQASYSINIPEFMGPIPSIQQHSMNNFSHNNATTLQQERFHEYNQFQNQQDQPSFNQRHPRGNQDSNYQYNSSMEDQEDPFCMYKEEHIQEGVNLCKNSLIGKILSNKPIFKSILQNSLQGIWGNPAGFTINEIEGVFST